MIIFVSSQLSRAVESRYDKHPMLSDLRDSSGIENISDVVIFIYSQKIDISLYPVFYDIIETNRLSHSENTRFELTETQSGHKKEPLKRLLI